MERKMREKTALLIKKKIFGWFFLFQITVCIFGYSHKRFQQWGYLEIYPKHHLFVTVRSSIKAKRSTSFLSTCRQRGVQRQNMTRYYTYAAHRLISHVFLVGFGASFSHTTPNICNRLANYLQKHRLHAIILSSVYKLDFSSRHCIFAIDSWQNSV